MARGTAGIIVPPPMRSCRGLCRLQGC
jgi:hypothetical protein